jgi:hypothetical protein
MPAVGMDGTERRAAPSNPSDCAYSAFASDVRALVSGTTSLCDGNYAAVWRYGSGSNTCTRDVPRSVT